MSFGGGGGSTGVGAHLHTNAVGEGGSLDNTTLINDSGLYAAVLSLG